MRLIIYFLFAFLCYISTSAQTTEEQEMLDLVNQLRQDRGLQPLRLNASLNQAAFNHSDDMAKNNYFSHTGLNGSNFSQRAIDAGYEGSPRGENIAAGNSGVEATFNQWKNSSGHLNNMLNTNINEMGIGHAYDSNSTYKHYWTQIFGKGEQTLSNEDITSIDKFKVYPNPMKDEITIKLNDFNNDDLNIKLVSLTGQIVYQSSNVLINNSIKLNISHLRSGVYFLHYNNEKKGYKLIKY